MTHIIYFYTDALAESQAGQGVSNMLPEAQQGSQPHCYVGLQSAVCLHENNFVELHHTKPVPILQYYALNWAILDRLSIAK